MAEFDELDGLLRTALGKAGQPGDSAGVADAIRSRVAAGDAGTSVASSTAPGWGGGAWSWMPWLGLIVVAGLVGGVVGVSGAAGRPAGDTVVDIPVAIGESAPVTACIDGPVVGRIPAGTRALAVERSDDSLWVGIRDPRALGGTLWVGLGDISLDDGMPALDALPVGGACPEPAVVTTPAPEPTEEPAPIPAPADTTPPTFLQAGATSPFYSANGQPTTVSAAVTDDRGVQRIDVAVFRPDGSTASGQMQNGGGGNWSFVYAPGPSPTGTYRFVLTAVDAAGNSSSTEVQVQGS